MDEDDIAWAGEPLLITEAVREAGGVIHQEVCFYYAALWPADVAPDSMAPLGGQRFRWVRLDELAGLRFLPPEIVGRLTDRTAGLRHLAYDRRGDPGRTPQGPAPDSGSALRGEGDRAGAGAGRVEA